MGRFFPFETGQERSAQPYLNYCAPTCPATWGGKKWWDSLESQVQAVTAYWFSP